MQKLNFAILLLILGLVARQVNVPLQVHRVDMQHGLEHPVQEVHPAQAYVGVNFVSFCVLEHPDIFMVSLVLHQLTDERLNFVGINLFPLALHLILHRSLNI